MGYGPPTASGGNGGFGPPPPPPPFGLGRVVSAATELSAAEIKAILRRENELRLSPETQRQFRAASGAPDGWLGVVEALQR
eukprot:SAG11_NODE_17605_length_513_cov_2.094203_1_plen_80_part_01